LDFKSTIGKKYKLNPFRYTINIKIIKDLAVLYVNLIMCITWLIFWYFNIGTYIKSKYFSAKFCLLIFTGFALRFIGDLTEIDIFVYTGGFVIFYALYKNIFPTKQPPQAN